MFCVECGKEPDKLYDGLCRECYIKSKIDVEIESPLKIEVCSSCGSVRRGNKWIEKPDIHAIMLEKIDNAISVSYNVDRYSFDADFEEEDPRNIKADVDVKLMSKDLTTEKKLTTKIIFKKEQCKICSRIHGNYYEAVLQVRPSKSDMTDEQKKLVRDKVKKRIEVKRGDERSIFLTFEEERHGGIDFYLSDKGVTKNLAYDISKAVGGNVTTSAKLVGMEDGQEVYRMTYSVRIPPYDLGDFIELKGELYRVNKLRGNDGQTVLKNIKTGKIERKDDKDLKGAEVLGGEELIKKAVTVSETEREMKILDPETYKTVTVIKPDNYKEIDGEVEVVKVKDHLYILSE